MNIPAYFICDAACWATYSLPGHTVGAVGDGEDSYFNETYGGEASDPSEVPAHFVQADTLEELAEKLGIDAAGLAAEIATFNENAAKGVDPVYHRGEKHLDINTTGVMAGSRTDLANPVLAPLATGPFYGAVYVPGTCGTAGGLTINENAQVVNVNGEPIEHLYAVGNCSSGVSGGTYVHGGISLGSGAVIVMDDTTCMVRACQRIARFYFKESCGQCTPCREGTGWMHRVLERIVAGKATMEDLHQLKTIAGQIEGHTICAFGEAAAWPIQGFLRQFWDEFEYYIVNGHSIVDEQLGVAA